ncbi:hypothetical protein [Nonomuraea salmonea]|uniref:hypothetical protein n=1 Tax=Nonomuraea salmonea TaxID=46181 RepID=UPI0031ED39BF
MMPASIVAGFDDSRSAWSALGWAAADAARRGAAPADRARTRTLVRRAPDGRLRRDRHPDRPLREHAGRRGRPRPRHGPGHADLDRAGDGGR